MAMRFQSQRVIFWILMFVVQNINGDVSITKIRLTKENRIRNITVFYTSSEKPVVYWRIGSYISHLDNSTNYYNGGCGEASVLMYVNPRAVDYSIVTWLYTDGYQVSLVYKNGAILDRSFEENTFQHLILHAGNDGVTEYTKGDTLNIDLSLVSEELPSFVLMRSWGNLMSMDLQTVPPVSTNRRHVAWRQRDSFARRNAFIVPRMNISGSEVIEQVTAVVNTSFPYTEGEIEFGISLNVGNSKSLLSKINLRRFVYVRERGHVGPYQNEVSFIRDNLNNKRSDILSDRFPYVQFSAIGFPKPILKLFRHCQEVTEPEVELTTVGTPFRTTATFRFRNVAEANGGPFYVTASNGIKEISKMNIMTIL